MKKRENKLLLGFLIFSLLILLVSIFFKEVPSANLLEKNDNSENILTDSREKEADKENSSVGLSENSNKDVDRTETSTGLREDLLNMNQDAIIDHFSGNMNAVSERQVSLNSYELKAETATHWKLPGHLLKEISGLAMTLDNRLMAHNDEEGVIHEIDYQKGAFVKTFQLADLKWPEKGDFEGIATVNDQVYLVTEEGRIYECSEGAAGESVLFNVYATGVGRDYHIEGLAYDANQRALLLMCKESRKDDLKEYLFIYHWSIDDKQLIEDAHIQIPLIEFTRQIGEKNFQPTGIEKHPISGNYFVIADGQKAIAEITPDGHIVTAKQFPAQWHRKPEGITFAADGTLIIADEGDGKKARLTLYPLSEIR